MKHTADPSGFRSRHASIRRTMCSGLVLFSFSLLPMAARADDFEVSDQIPAVVATQFSTGDKELLAAALLLAASLVGMERFCSWRLTMRHRRVDGARSTMAECVPQVASGPSSLLSTTPEA